MIGDARKMPDGERETARALIQRLNIPVYPAPFDYIDYMKDGKIDIKAMSLRSSDTERVLRLSSCYTVYEKDWNGARRVQFIEPVREKIKELLEFFNRHDLQYVDDTPYYNNRTYTMNFGDRLNSSMYIGKMNGKPFIEFNSLLAEISEEEYDYWCIWMKEESKKVQQND